VVVLASVGLCKQSSIASTAIEQPVYPRPLNKIESGLITEIGMHTIAQQHFLGFEMKSGTFIVQNSRQTANMRL
jgi:hypothetical protein